MSAGDLAQVALPRGAGATIQTRITFGIQRRVRAALERYRGTDPDARQAAEGEVVVAMTTAWTFVDDAGAGIPITLEGVDQVDADAVDELFAACVTAYRKGTAIAPKGAATGSLSPTAQP